MRSYHLLLLACFALLAQLSHAQGFVWAKRMGGPQVDEAHALVIDHNGDILSTGRFQGTVDFDPGPNVSNLVATSANRECYIQKLNPAGELIWAKLIGGQDNDFGVAITVDPGGNIYVAGYFADVVDFDPGPGQHVIEEQHGGVFILKLDPAGNFIWVKTIAGGYFYSPELDYSFGDCLQLDAQGNVYLTAGFNDTADFDPGPDEHLLTAEGFCNAFILKLDPVGNFVWVKHMGGIEDDCGMSMNFDATGNLYTTGYFTKTVDFDPGPDVFDLVSKGGNDVFIQKLDPDGNFLWAKSFGTLLYDEFGNGLAVDAEGNVYVTGNFTGNNLDFDPGPGIFELDAFANDDIFIVKLNTQGDFVWAKQMGGKNGNERSRRLRIDAAGHIYNIGEFGLTADFDPGPGVVELESFGNNHDIYIQKLDSDGNLIWVKQLGGAVGSEKGSAIALDAEGELFATGSFGWIADFDPSTEVINLEAAGQQDVFVCRLGLGLYWDIHGKVFRDQNANGVRDTGEMGIPNLVLKAKNKGFVYSTNASGDYHFYYDVLQDTLRVVVPSKFSYWSVQPTFAVPDSPKDTIDFAISIPPGIKDVAVTAVEMTTPRPGFTTEMVVQLHNYGSEVAKDVRAIFEINNLPVPLEYVDAVPTPAYASSDSVVWLIDSISPSGTADLRLFFRTLTTTPINTIISYQVRAVVQDDVYLSNNFFGSRTTVQGAYDPNDKQVLPTKIPVETQDSALLQYVVRFQNTGTLPAEFVVISDTLPPNVDAASLELMSSSHPCTWQLSGKGFLDVRFDPIFLPDSTSNEPASHGFVAFTIKPRLPLPVGALISNRAGIYFDYNPPIITNYAVTKITATSSLSEPGKKDWLDIGLSPNPVPSHLPVLLQLPPHESAAVVKVFDMQGKLLRQVSVAADNQQVSLANGLPVGTYWVQVRIGSLMGGKKLIVR